MDDRSAQTTLPTAHPRPEMRANEEVNSEQARRARDCHTRARRARERLRRQHRNRLSIVRNR